MSTFRLRRLEKLERTERAVVGEYERRISEVQAWFAEEWGRLAKERRLVDWTKDDPPVTVRISSGAPLRVYHAVDGDCRWRSPNGQYMLRSDAIIRGLRPCSSWQCRKYLQPVETKAS